MAATVSSPSGGKAACLRTNFKRVLEAPERVRKFRINQKGSHRLRILCCSPVFQPVFIVLRRLVDRAHRAGFG